MCIQFQEEAYIKNELADVTFGELHKALSDGTLALHGKRHGSESKSKRANKNRFGSLQLNCCYHALVSFVINQIQIDYDIQ